MMPFIILCKIFFAAIIAFLITFYSTPILIDIAYRFNILDNPDSKLKKHAHPTPYLGGGALYVGCISALALVLPFHNSLAFFLIGSTLLLCLGFIDDLVPMSPGRKFFGQLIATLCFLKGGLYLKELFFIDTSSTIASFLLIVFSALWILSVINAFNLVDVMDGLATILALLATISFLLVACLLGCYVQAFLLAALFGALIAFFLFNKPIALIYLGDSGSLFLGGFLATIPFLIPWGQYTCFGYFAPIIILAIPLLELFTLVVIRTYRRIPFYCGSPDHFAIVLQRQGWSKWDVLSYVMLFQIPLTSVALLHLFNKIPTMLLSIIGFFIILAWYIVLLFWKKTKKATLLL